MVEQVSRASRFGAVFCAVGALAWAVGACGSSRQESDGATPGTGGATGGSGGRSGAGSGGASRGGTAGSIAVEGAGAGGDCEREVTLQAVVLGEPAPFDLVIVADHSDSLAWSRDDLSAGLRDLLTNVRGRAVRVFVLTPTQYGESSAAARIPLSGDALVAWQDAETGAAYTPAMTAYEQTCTHPDDTVIECPDPRAHLPYKAVGEWKFVMPEPIAVLEPALTDAEFAAEQQAVTEAILAIGGTGSPNEQPLCTLARYVDQAPEALPQNAVFLLVSDEDDVSVPDDCLKSYRAELKVYDVAVGETDCSSDCDVVRFGMAGTRNWERFPFVCSAYADTGEKIPGSDQMSWYNSIALENCENFDARPCNDGERATVGRFCDSGLELSDCQRECAAVDGACSIDAPDDSVDLCTQSFEHNGQTWQNLPEYCASLGGEWHGCASRSIKIVYDETYAGSYKPENLMPGATTASVSAYFRTKAATAFGAGRFLVQGILLDPEFSCELGPGQSYGTNLAATIGDRNNIFPLCESYAPALEGVVDFAQALIQTEFTVTLKEDEEITSVVVIAKDGSERTLPASAYTFDEETGTLGVLPSAIRGSDANLRVEVTSDCRPVVR